MLSYMVSVAKTGSCSTTQAQCGTHAYATHAHTHNKRVHTHMHTDTYTLLKCVRHIYTYIYVCSSIAPMERNGII